MRLLKFARPYFGAAAPKAIWAHLWPMISSCYGDDR